MVVRTRENTCKIISFAKSSYNTKRKHRQFFFLTSVLAAWQFPYVQSGTILVILKCLLHVLLFSFGDCPFYDTVQSQYDY